MTAEYALGWLVKNHMEDIGTWPVGMAVKCSEFMAEYGKDQVSWARKQDAEKVQQAQKESNATNR